MRGLGGVRGCMVVRMVLALGVVCGVWVVCAYVGWFGAVVYAHNICPQEDTVDVERKEDNFILTRWFHLVILLLPTI